jgi:hypothetical protein
VAILRIELRKAYNQVALFGAEDARITALVLWRTAHNAGNDILRDLGADADVTATLPDLAERIRSAASHIGTVGVQFLEACRKDLQGG